MSCSDASGRVTRADRSGRWRKPLCYPTRADLLFRIPAQLGQPLFIFCFSSTFESGTLALSRVSRLTSNDSHLLGGWSMSCFGAPGRGTRTDYPGAGESLCAFSSLFDVHLFVFVCVAVQLDCPSFVLTTSTLQCRETCILSRVFKLKQGGESRSLW
jgi:hypothetical protein